MPNPRTPEDFLPGTKREITEFDFGNFIADAENGLRALGEMTHNFHGFDSSKRTEIYDMIEDIKVKIKDLKATLGV